MLLEQKATVFRALLLGFSVAIAVSAKYIGALLFIPALVAVLRNGGREFRVNRVAEFVLAFLFAILVINFYAVTELPLTALRRGPPLPGPVSWLAQTPRTRPASGTGLARPE